MIKSIIKLFIKDSDNTEDRYVREKYGVLSGVLGIICNTFLFGVKISIGTFMNSIAIISDAFNNLSDCGSSLVSVISAKMSNMHPDDEHPFGHGRIEYISSLIVAFFIILVGVELFKGSFAKLFEPSEVNFSLPLIIILLLSVFVKMWMFFYNRYIGKKINSAVVRATAADSINDVMSSCVIILSVVIDRFVNLPVDAAMGIIVSVIIVYAGFKIARETISTLLGTPPDPQLVHDLKQCVLDGDGIYGVHDLVVHDYGPGRIMASVHAEVPDNADIVRVHEIIDGIERDAFGKYGVQLVVHMDPVSVNCARTNEFKSHITEIVTAIDNRLTIHDFRITDGQDNINLIFDMVVPGKWKKQQLDDTVEAVRRKISEYDSRCRAVINIDTDFSCELDKK